MAQKQYLADDLDDAAETLEKNFRVESRPRKAPKAALEIYALILEKSDEYLKSLKLTNYLIIKSYSQKNLQTLKLVQRGKAPPPVPKKLKFYYLKKADLYAKLLDQVSQESFDDPQIDFYRQKSQFYVKVLKALGSHKKRIKSVITQVNQISGRLRKIKKDREQFRTSTFVGLSYASWQDNFILNTPSGEEALLVTASGPCINGGLRWNNANREWNLQGQFCPTSATVGTETSSSFTTRDGDSLSAFFIGPGFLWRPKEKEIALGLQVPLYYAALETELGVTDTLDSESRISAALLLESQWIYQRWAFVLKAGRIIGATDNLFQLQINFEL